MSGQAELPRRSRYCGDFRTEHVGQECCVMGWVHSYRDHGGVLIDLRPERIGADVADPSASRVLTPLPACGAWVAAAVGRGPGPQVASTAGDR